MMGPIDYTSLQTQLNVAPLQNALALRDQRQQAQEAIAERQAVRQLAERKFDFDRQEQADYVAAVEAYKADPTPAGLRDLGLRFPDQAKALREAGDSYTATQKQDLIGAGFGALGALSAGKNDVAIKTLQDRVTALKGSGIDTTHTQAAIDMIKAGDVRGATAYLSYAMGGLVGEDHAASVLETLGVGGKADDRRADNARADRQADIAERRVANAERATNAAIARGAAASARADRKAAGGGKGGRGGGAGKVPAGFVLD